MVLKDSGFSSENNLRFMTTTFPKIVYKFWMIMKHSISNFHLISAMYDIYNMFHFLKFLVIWLFNKLTMNSGNEIQTK